MFSHKSTTILATTALAAALAALAVGPTAHAASLPISSCGQVVTTSAFLTKDLNCAGASGIIVGAPGITIDFKGHVVRGDRLIGHYGVYDLYDDVTIKNGTVRNFEEGVYVVNHPSGVTVSGIVATGNVDYGMYVYGTSARIASSAAAGNGGTGIYVEGDSASVTSSTAAGNGVYGIWVNGAAPTVRSSSASANGNRGIWVEGDSAKVMSATASGNGAAGIAVGGVQTTVKSSTASGNGGIGINVGGDQAVVQGNRAEGNGFAGGVSDNVGTGISVGSAPTPAVGTKNVARGNDDPDGCSPSWLCPMPVSSPNGTPITSCGQTVTDDAVLSQDLSCPGSDGIVVGSSGITIDLNGHVLRGDGVAGHDGISVDTYDQVTIRNGTVRNFGYGIDATNGAAGLAVSNMVVSGSTMDGVFALDAGVKITKTTVARNGLKGITVGDSASVTSTTAVGNAYGIEMQGSGLSLRSTSAVGNTQIGVLVDGNSASIASATASGNGSRGISVTGNSVSIKSTTVSGNGAFGIVVAGDAPVLNGNRADGNGFPGGASDGVGKGISADGYTIGPVGTNRARGNDASMQCFPSSLC
jgi:Periplasmic copper-binding protein (NosD)/Right handed beta helix region